MYINGATAEPCVNTIKPPNKTKTIIIGKSQYFFLTFKNSQNSLIKLILKLIFHSTFWAMLFNPIRLVIIIFFLVVTPTGLIMRLLGKDLLNLKYNKNQSYWIEKKGPKSKMKNQF